MKSLASTRRLSPIVLISIGIAMVAVFGCLLVALNVPKSAPVNNAANLFITDPVAERPTISSSDIKQPITAVPIPDSDAAINAAISQTAVAQSVTSGSRVSYPSLQITPSQRDRLFVVAFSIIVIGGSLYAMTLLRTEPRPVVVSRRPLYKVFDT